MGDGLHLQRRRRRHGAPMNAQQQQARHTVAEELRANLRRHQADVSDGLTAQAAALEAQIAAARTAMETRIEAAVQAVEARATILHRGFWGRVNWLLTGR